MTGAPVRRAIRDVDRTCRSGGAIALGLPADRFLVAVTGGSLGSGALNDGVPATPPTTPSDAGLAIHQVVGERFVADLVAVGDGRGGLSHRVVGYEPRMDLVYAAADLLVGRGGASTVAEVAVTGTPAILVPWPAAAEDHQTGNVRWLADQGAAVHLPESQLGRLGAVRRAAAPPTAALPGRQLAPLPRRAAEIATARSDALIDGIALPDRAVTGQ